ncbi:MAG: tol-pal system YbgF family protein [Elusimicrobiota bacterium]
MSRASLALVALVALAALPIQGRAAPIPSCPDWLNGDRTQPSCLCGAEIRAGDARRAACAEAALIVPVVKAANAPAARLSSLLNAAVSFDGARPAFGAGPEAFTRLLDGGGAQADVPHSCVSERITHADGTVTFVPCDRPTDTREPREPRNPGGETGAGTSHGYTCGLGCAIDRWSRERAARKEEQRRAKVRAEFNRLVAMPDSEAKMTAWLVFYNRTQWKIAAYNWAITAFNVKDYASALNVFTSLSKNCDSSSDGIRPDFDLCKQAAVDALDTVEAEGDAYYKLKEYRRAEERYLTAIGDGDRRPGAWWGLSRAVGAQDRWVDAQQDAYYACTHTPNGCNRQMRNQFSRQYYWAFVNVEYAQAMAIYKGTCAQVGAERRCGILDIPRAYWTDEIVKAEREVERKLGSALPYDETTGIPANGARLFYAALLHAKNGMGWEDMARHQVDIILKTAPDWEPALRLQRELAPPPAPPHNPTPLDRNPDPEGWIHYADGTAWRVGWDDARDQARCEFMHQDRRIDVVPCH